MDGILTQLAEDGLVPVSLAELAYVAEVLDFVQTALEAEDERNAALNASDAVTYRPLTKRVSEALDMLTGYVD